MIKILKYSMREADENKVHTHPQTMMKLLGYNVIDCMPMSVFDCWMFKVEDDEDKPLPPFLEIAKYDWFEDDKQINERCK